MSQDEMIKILNSHGIYREVGRGKARSGMNMLEVIFNAYHKYDRSEEYLREGLTKWWEAFGVELGYFVNQTETPPVDVLYKALNTMSISQ